MKFASLLLTLFCVTAAVAQNAVGWTLVWSDEFAQPDGSPPDSAKWTYDIGASGWGNNEWQYYTSRTNNARIENGQLIIEARKENYSGANYTSARLKTQGKAAWRYGRIEARIKIPRGQGIWPAFWMLGTNITSVNWPNCGEIDILENIGKEPTNVYGTIHGPGYSGGASIGRSYSLPDNAAFADAFHIYAVEWTTNSIRWFLDGQQYFSASPASLPNGSTWVFTQPQFLLLNVAVGGNWPGYPDATTTFPQQMIVDWVRVYAPTNLPTGSTNALANPGFEMGGLANWNLYGNVIGNAGLQRVNAGPVRTATNSFKLFGGFTGGQNFSGAYADTAASAGDVFRAQGWTLTPAGDRIAESNQAWVEVSFRNAASEILTLYRSSPVSSNSPAGAWLKLTVTNQINPANGAIIASVTNLVAPASTAFVRYQIVYRQVNNAPGAVYFDDHRLLVGAALEVPVPASITATEQQLALTFESHLEHSYQVLSKNSLNDPEWTLMTNVSGSGTGETFPLDPESDARFFRVTRPDDW